MFQDENTQCLLFVFDSLAEGKCWKYERLNCMKW